MPIISQIDQFVIQNNLDISAKLSLLAIKSQIANIFSECYNDYQIKKWLVLNDFMQEFEIFTINRELAEVSTKGEVSFEPCAATGILLPLSFQIRKFFEKEDLLLKVLTDIEEEKFPENHFINRKLWKEKSKSFSESNKIVLPIFLYIDDAEVNNPLGSHCEPITFLYYSFPVVKNSEILLAAVINSKDYKKYDNEKCLSKLVEDLIILEEGVNIKTSKGDKYVHFVLGIIVGDNLAQNLILVILRHLNTLIFADFAK